LSWTAPEEDGGSPVTNYVVECRKMGAYKWLSALSTMEKVTQTSLTIPNLHEDQEYEFRVAAENKAGLGSFVEAPMVIRAKSPIGEDIFTKI
jgi:titin